MLTLIFKTEISSNNNRTALHYASENGHTSIVKMLILNGAEVNIQSNYNSTPLHWACSSGHLTSAKELVRHGGCLSITNTNSQRPLDYIVNESDRNLLKVQEEMFRKWKNTTDFVIVLSHFNIAIDKSKEGTNRAVFDLRLKDVDKNENHNQLVIERVRTRPREVISCVFENIHFCQIICNYL